jgi:hypothetical protein
VEGAAETAAGDCAHSNRLKREPDLRLQGLAQRFVCSITGPDPAATATLYKLVKSFSQLGLLEEITRQTRNRRVRYAPYIQLFADPET